MSTIISPVIFVFLALAFTTTTVLGDEESLQQQAPAPAPVPMQPKPRGILETHGFSFNNGYGLNAGLDNNASPEANIKVYGGGSLGPGTVYFRDDPTTANPVQFELGGQNFLGLGGAFVLGAFLALSLWYGCLWLLGSNRIADMEDLKSDSPKNSRKRRAIQADESLTRLADIVLTAIESGQCMQKSICLLGTQLGAGSAKSVLAANLLGKMIPESVQHSPYFSTLQSVLRGKLDCDKIRCGGLASPK